MHELALVEDVFRIILKVAAENRLERIERVSLVIGEYRQVSLPQLEFAFDAAKEGTIASTARLETELQPVELKCRECGNIFSPPHQGYDCDVCRSDNIEFLKGREIFIKSLEGE